MTRRNLAVNRLNRFSRRNASPFSKPSLVHAARVMAPTLIALTFATAAHAQGTMDFSGATTLMGTFKTFAMYAGAVICLGGLIFAGIRMMSGRFHFSTPSTAARYQQSSMRYTNNPTGTKDRAGHFANRV